MYNINSTETLSMAPKACALLVLAMRNILKEYNVAIYTVLPSSRKMPYLQIFTTKMSEKGVISGDHLCMEVNIQLYSDADSNIEVMTIMRVLQSELEGATRSVCRTEANDNIHIYSPIEITSIHVKDVEIKAIANYNWWHATSNLEMVIRCNK